MHNSPGLSTAEKLGLYPQSIDKMVTPIKQRSHTDTTVLNPFFLSLLLFQFSVSNLDPETLPKYFFELVSFEWCLM